MTDPKCTGAPAPRDYTLPPGAVPRGNCIHCGLPLFQRYTDDSAADYVAADGVNACHDRIRRHGGGTGHQSNQPRPSTPGSVTP
jgi:hypothetical protein